jgi:endonuclease IV
MFGFNVSREWAPGKRPSIRAHLESAVRYRDSLVNAPESPPFAFQVYIAGPHTLQFTVDETEAADLKAVIHGTDDLWGVAHGTYLDTPWDRDAHNHNYRCGFIRREIARAVEAGLSGVVIHLGVPSPDAVVDVLPWIYPSEIGGKSVRETIQQRAAGEAAQGASLPRIYLEVPHVLPKNSHYETPEKLAVLFRAIREKCDPGLQITGLCIDTAHIWACGADISSYANGKAWVDGLAAVHDIIPPDAIMFHLNDNRHVCGSGRDEHDPLLHGEIWGAYRRAPQDSGLAAFIEYAIEYDIPTVLERKDRKPTGDEPAMTTREALQCDYDALFELGAR